MSSQEAIYIQENKQLTEAEGSSTQGRDGMEEW